jgi:Tol biopolymer transport system component
MALAVRRPGVPASDDVTRVGIALGATAGSLCRQAGSPGHRWKSFAYIGVSENGGRQVWIRSLDALTPTPVAGTEGASSPFFSPDGQQIGFMIDSPFSLRVVPRSGGRATIVTTDGVSGGGADWSTDGYIYFDGLGAGPGHPGGTGLALADLGAEVIKVEPLEGDNTRNLLAAGAGFYPVFNRNKKSLAVDLKTRKRKSVVNATFARYVPSGHLLYVLADGSLMAARFDVDRLEIIGAPLLIARGLRIAAFGAADVSISSTGSLLYTVGRGITTAEPLWVDRNGASTPVDSSWRDVFASSLALSPDGSRLAMHLSAFSSGSTSRTEDIWVKQMPAGAVSRLTFEGEQNRRPTWSHDGRDILFLSSRSGPPALYRQRADGSAKAERIAAWTGGLAEGFESPDGRWIIVRTEQGSPGDGDIRAMQIGVDTAPTPLIATQFREASPALSPDGRWIAYASDETGRSEVYVRAFPDVNAGKVQASTAGGAAPRWSHKATSCSSPTRRATWCGRRAHVALLRRRQIEATVLHHRLRGCDRPGASRVRRRARPTAVSCCCVQARQLAFRDDTPQTILVQHFDTELKKLLP